MSIKEMRALLGLSQEAFAQKYNIPKRTIEGWESNSPTSHRECPRYVRQLLERCVLLDYEATKEEKNRESE